MANIRNSISMVDRMTPTLRSIMRAMDSTMAVMRAMDKATPGKHLDKEFARADEAIRMANNSIIKMSNHSLRAAQDAEGVADAWDSVNKSVKKSRASIGHIMNTMASGIYSIKSLISGIGTVTGVSDRAMADIAKLSLFNTTPYSDAQLYSYGYQVAQQSRSGLSETSNLAQRIMLSGVYEGEGASMAAFDLAGTINKAMVLGGGTAEENSRAILQLSQALSSGILQGDELRSIREQSPYLAKVLAEGLANIDDKFIGTTIGDLKELGAQGELTSDVVIRALQSMEGEISTAFDTKAPKTFSGAMQQISNSVQYFMSVISQADGPLGRLNATLWNLADYLATPAGFELLSGIIPVLNVVVIGFQLLAAVIQFVGNNLSWIAPIMGTILAYLLAYNAYLAVTRGIALATSAAEGIRAVAAYASARAQMATATAAAAAGSAAAGSATAFLAESMATSAATAAQHGLNAALWASPITWIIAIIIAVIALLFIVIGVINKVTGSSISAIGVIVGALATAGAFIANLFFGLLEIILGILEFLINPWIEFANFIGNVFTNPVSSIIYLFQGMADTVLGIIQKIASALDFVFGSNMAETVQGWRDGLKTAADNLVAEYAPNENYEEIISNLDVSMEDFGIDRFNYSDAWDAGYSAGENIQDSITGAFDMDSMIGDMSELTAGVGDLPVEVAGGDLDSVGTVKSDVNLNDEDIQLLRDMAARDYLLQLQTITPVANVTFGDVRETADVGVIVEVIEQMVDEQMATALVS